MSSGTSGRDCWTEAAGMMWRPSRGWQPLLQEREMEECLQASHVRAWGLPGAVSWRIPYLMPLGPFSLEEEQRESLGCCCQAQSKAWHRVQVSPEPGAPSLLQGTVSGARPSLLQGIVIWQEEGWGGAGLQGLVRPPEKTGDADSSRPSPCRSSPRCPSHSHATCPCKAHQPPLCFLWCAC